MSHKTRGIRIRHRVGLACAMTAIAILVVPLVLGYIGAASLDAPTSPNRALTESGTGRSTDAINVATASPDVPHGVSSADQLPSYDIVSASMYWLLHRPSESHESMTFWVAENTGSAENSGVEMGSDETEALPVMVTFNRIEVDLGEHTIGSLAGQLLGR